jgi:hypothetical protein
MALIGAVGGEALEDTAAVLNLGLNEGGGEGETESGVVVALILGKAGLAGAARRLAEAEHSLGAGV